MELSPKSSALFERAEFELWPSPRLALFLRLTHGLSCLAFLSLPFPIELRAAACIATVAVFRKTRLRLFTRRGRLVVERDGGWRFKGRGYVLSDWYCHPWLCVLYLRDGRRREALVLPADAMSDDDHRRLRVLLRVKFNRRLVPML